MGGMSTLRKPAACTKAKAKAKATPAPALAGLPAEGNESEAAPRASALKTASVPATPKASPKGHVKIEVSSPNKAAAAKATAAKASAAKDTGAPLALKDAAGKYPRIPEKQAKALNQKLKSLSLAGKPGLQEGFNRCKSQQEKRAFYYEVYLLDPEVSNKKVAKRDTQEEDDNETVQKGWFTDDEVAQFKGILPQNDNYSKLKEAACQGCPERDHEDQNLSALGVKQYYYEHHVAKTSSSKKRLLELEEEVGEVAAEDFEEIRKKLKGDITQKMIGSSSAKGGSPAEGKGGSQWWRSCQSSCTRSSTRE